MLRRPIVALMLLLSALWTAAGAAEAPSVEDAQAALHKAVDFFRTQVSAHGGYLWRYADDLALREGEGKADDQTAWVQPPGTPSIGEAYLDVYELTGDAYYLEAARETAHALVRGQLRSGGWDYRIFLGESGRARHAYRVDGGGSGSNVSTLDDDTTQAALRFLMRADRALGFADESIHAAARYGLEALLAAQYPNGAWPQRFSGPPDPAKHPVKPASYPESWPRVFPKEDYASFYTFNDNLIQDVVETMFLATEVYGEERFRAAAERAGEFILLAQMPDPQPGWAQQYNHDMHPAWARRFEPPAVTGGESQGVMRTLLYLYRRTGNPRYLEPLPRAIEYYRASLLPDGRLARFYELETNKPLYFTKEYELTYSSDDMPTHYAFIVGSGLDAIEAEFEALKAAGPPRLEAPPRPEAPTMTADLARRARAAIDALDERGAWVQAGPLRYHDAEGQTGRVIDCQTFADNVRTLARFIAAAR